jgi:signal transduction histidine kinase
MTPVLKAIAGRNILTHATMDPELEPTLADPIHLEQLLLNLTVNAVEAMPAGGVLHVATTNVLARENRRLAAGWLPAGSYVMLSVSDTGVGIPAGALENVFDASFSTKGQRGLGLASVSQIAQDYSGAVDVQTARGRGTTFNVYLPRVVRPESHPVSQWRLR